MTNDTYRPLSKLKVLDLFSGIGGFSLGLERTGGFETVAFCEIDPFCQKVLKKHWPDVPNAEALEALDKMQSIIERNTDGGDYINYQTIRAALEAAPKKGGVE